MSTENNSENQLNENPHEPDVHEVFTVRNRELDDILNKDRRDTYTFTVVFTRSLGDDLGCGGKPIEDFTKPIGQALLEQFEAELQTAYDEGGMAGHFSVVSGPNFPLGYRNLHNSKYEPYHKRAE